MPPLICVIGPTGSGKTALAEAIALACNGELVSADSRQLYKGMDIGTSKEKNLRVPQHLIDLLNPGEKVTAAWYQEKAYTIIDDILARGKTPILVGGSMLYAEAVMNGYVFGEDGKSTKQIPRYSLLKIQPAMSREELTERIPARVQSWLDAGLLSEIKTLLDQGTDPQWLDHCGLEYRYFTQHLLGKLALEEASDKTMTALRQYIKRQYTWWRRHMDILSYTEKEGTQKAQEFLQTSK